MVVCYCQSQEISCWQASGARKQKIKENSQVVVISTTKSSKRTRTTAHGQEILNTCWSSIWIKTSKLMSKSHSAAQTKSGRSQLELTSLAAWLVSTCLKEMLRWKKTTFWIMKRLNSFHGTRSARPFNLMADKKAILSCLRPTTLEWKGPSFSPYQRMLTLLWSLTTNEQELQAVSRSNKLKDKGKGQRTCK